MSELSRPPSVPLSLRLLVKADLWPSLPYGSDGLGGPGGAKRPKGKIVRLPFFFLACSRSRLKGQRGGKGVELTSPSFPVGQRAPKRVRSLPPLFSLSLSSVQSDLTISSLSLVSSRR